MLAAQYTEMASVCKAYNTLPRAGGLLDQDSLLVSIMIAYEDAMTELQAKKQAQQAAKGKR